MSINAVNSSLSALNEISKQMSGVAHTVATSMGAPAVDEPPAEDPERALTSMNSLSAANAANIKVIEANSEMVGTLLDILV